MISGVTRHSGNVWIADAAAMVAIGFLVAAQVLLAVRSAALSHDAMEHWSQALELIATIVVPALFTCMACRAHGLEGPRVVSLPVMIVAGAAMRLVHFAAEPIAETDHYRYLWDGALVVHGYNPYVRPPQDFAAPSTAGSVDPLLAGLIDQARSILASINFPDLTSIYPTTAQIVFAGAHLIAPFDVRGLRFFCFIADLATLVLVIRWLDQTGRPRAWAALFWLNPLMVLATANQAHIDAVLPPLILAAMRCADARRPIAAGSMLALAAGVKIWPLALLPILVRRIVEKDLRLRSGFLLGSTAAAASLLTIGPLLWAGYRQTSGLSAYALQWANNNAYFAWASYVLHWAAPDWPTDRALRAALLAIGAVTSLMVARRRIEETRHLIQGCLIVAATAFYLSPAQFPWYGLWFLPLAAIAGSLPLAAATLLLPVYYLFFPMAAAGTRDGFFFWVAFVHSAPLFGWLLIEMLKSRCRRPVSRPCG